MRWEVLASVVRRLHVISQRLQKPLNHLIKNLRELSLGASGSLLYSVRYNSFALR